MATKLLYLEDFDVVSCEATIVDIQKTEDERTDVILDQTCFYPRGGGQDWDTGTIGDFVVEEVRLDPDGVVHHIGSGEYNIYVIKSPVQCKVDAERRDANTRLHSAGHVLDMAMQTIKTDWVPGRGAHYPHMSFVEYDVPADAMTDEDFRAALEAKVNQVAQSAYQNQVKFVSKGELSQYCKHVPENIPTNKPTRVVLYADDFGIPCGGTHVKQLKDIGTIRITKLKIKKQVAKVSYAVDGIN